MAGVSLRDGLILAAHRDHFADLRYALNLVGVVLRERDRDDFLPPADCESEESTSSVPDAELDDILPSSDGWTEESVQRAEQELAGDETEAGDPATELGRSDVRSTESLPGRQADDRQSSRTSRPGVANDQPTKLVAAILPARDDEGAAQATDSGRTDRTRISIPRSPHLVTHSIHDRAVFNTRTLRASLHDMARVPEQGTELRIDVIVDRIARQEPMRQLPTRMRRGQPDRIHVLVDLRLRSGPFRDDLNYVLKTLERLFGVSRIIELFYLGTPLDGCGSGPVWTWEPYAVLPAPISVVIVGLGIESDQGSPAHIDVFARSLTGRATPTSVVLLGADPALRPSRAYPQLLVRD